MIMVAAGGGRKVRNVILKKKDKLIIHIESSYNISQATLAFNIIIIETLSIDINTLHFLLPFLPPFYLLLTVLTHSGCYHKLP